MRQHKIGTQTFKIITQYGDMLVVRQSVQPHQQQHHHHYHHHQKVGSGGHDSQTKQAHSSENQQQQQQQQQQSTSRPVIMTFHDLGLNSELQFATFCECDEVKLMLQTFTMIHVNFIGQEFELNGQPASSLPEDFKYPTVEQMAECIVDICAQLRVRSFIGLAVGAGAHIVGSLALLRPDLVHGLFLINPVLSSCSISEWLCFKMSAIASNQPLAGGSPHGASHSSTGSEQPEPDSSQGSPDRAHHSSGFRKLWNRIHHHQHHHHGARSRPSSNHSSMSQGQGSPSSASSANTQAVLVGAHERLAASGGESSGRASADSPTGSSQSSLTSAPKPAASYRLRQLILSRNFRMGMQQMARQESHEESACQGDGQQQEQEKESKEAARWQHHRRRQSATNSIDTQMADVQQRSEPLGARLGRRRFSGGASSLTSQRPASPTGRANKRPPVEYLMYHHFGSASFQRFRRPSVTSESPSTASGDTESPLASSQSTTPATTSQAADGSNTAEQQHRLSCDSSGNGLSQSSATAAAAANMMARRMHRNSRDSASGALSIDYDSASRKSADSPVRINSEPAARSRAQRSSSVCLTARHLASFADERQRVAYMQMVYKQYFTQINAHNLWLFAQSFIKRRALNLRKDCGAAAHAAAAAAALGTSICAAFVGIAPAVAAGADQATSGDKQEVGPSSAGVARAGDEKLTGAGKAASEANQLRRRQQQQQRSKGQSSDKQQALVAGTKVKRTFTCQTLIMCSSVQIHCERALKLMSLLNPLQATWIKTDQMLVLEEKPEKVCQALRLFLQGIGYSMSTYERRLRLNSAQASFSSADSNGSARSLSEPTPAGSQQCVQAKPLGSREAGRQAGPLTSYI